MFSHKGETKLWVLAGGAAEGGFAVPAAARGFSTTSTKPTIHSKSEKLS